MRLFLAALVCCVALQSSALIACQQDGYALRGLSQDWPEKDRDSWYSLSQGSRLVPLAWYNALSLPGSDTPFSARDVQAQYGTLLCEDEGWPIGFVVDETERDVAALGLTCSACHTGVLHDGTHSFIVEGGSSDLDLQSYMKDMFAGLLETFRDAGPAPGPRWQSFAGKVLGSDHSAEDALALETEVRDWLQRRYQIQQSIEAGGSWGHGRTDAVAVILNTATVLSGQRAGVTLPPATAPTSYPHVWNAPQMQRVQWNGSATKIRDIGVVGNIELGATTRNLAEVLGVFAEIELTTDRLNDTSSYPSLVSSARLANLVRLERTMETMKSPSWPAEWGAVDKSSPEFQRGKQLYAENCASCHAIMDRTDLTTRIWDSPKEDGKAYSTPFTKLIPAFDMVDLAEPGLGTDPLMSCNALTHTSWTGKFELLHDSFGAFRQLVGEKDITALVPDKFEKGTVTLRLIEELALRMTYEKRGELMALQRADMREEASAFFTGLKEGLFGSDPGRHVDPANIGDRPKEGTHALQTLNSIKLRCTEFLLEEFLAGNGDAIPMYKARPLNGIFASPPYLHNGSVPTLDALLRPRAERPERFVTGLVKYDRDRLGLGEPLVTGPSSEFNVRDGNGAIIPGNYNGGHEFLPSSACGKRTNENCENDRAALLEYLKSL